MPAGRPTSYKPEYCQELIDYMKNTPWGTFRTFAVHIGVHSAQLYRWCEKYEDFRSSKRLAEDIIAERLLKQGHENINDKSFNGTMWIWLTKNQMRYRDNPETTEDENENDYPEVE